MNAPLDIAALPIVDAAIEAKLAAALESNDRDTLACTFGDLIHGHKLHVISPGLRQRILPVYDKIMRGGKSAIVERAQSALTAIQAESGTYVSLICGGDLTPEPIGWLWKDYLAQGKLHILAGEPGVGKSTMALALAATITIGGRFPDGSRCDAGDVLIWSGEDDATDTLLPRLVAHGADKSRVYFVDSVRVNGESLPFDPAKHMQALREAASQIPDLRLLIVDPIVNAVLGDSHKAAEVRRSLQPIVDLGAAAIGISHFSKGTQGRNPVERVTGSGAFGQLPRLVFAAAKDQDGRRIFVRTKSNIGPDGGGFQYDLEQVELESVPGLFASRVLWGEALEGSARDLLAVADAEHDPEEKSATDETADWLREMMREAGGEMEKREVMRLGRAEGFSDSTIHRARQRLRCKVRTTGFGKDKRSKWTLPPDSTPSDPDADELLRLINEKADREQWPDADRAETVEISLRSVDKWLPEFRQMAMEQSN